MIVDLAHASPALITEVLAMARKPVIVSHTGVQGTCKGPRNLTDDALRAVAANNGVVGIGYWDAAVCDITPRGIAKAIRYAVTDRRHHARGARQRFRRRDHDRVRRLAAWSW